MSDYVAQLTGVLRAVAFHRPLTYSWLGSRVAALPRSIRVRLSPEAVQAQVLHELRFQLYRDFYCQGGAVTRRALSPAALPGYTTFAQRLAEANAGHGSWEAGWQIVALEDGYLLTIRNDLTLRLRAAEYRVQTDMPTPGAPLEVCMPKDLFSLSPGYYMALGEAPTTAFQTGPLLRLYWNVGPAGAIRLFELLTMGLNTVGVPFRLKALHSPSAYIRADAVVLYLAGAHFAPARAILERSYMAIREHLAPAVPALTLRLAPGLGLAEDPGPGESFGLHRCGLLAEALLHAYKAGQEAEAARMDAVAARFTAAGLDLARPYLGPGSQAVYELAVGSPMARASRRLHAQSDDFAGAALAIGRRLAEDAIWHKERCNWIGADPDNTSVDGGVAYRALGPDLYTGTAGVGLFLIELWRVTGDPGARRAGRGALHQALSRVETIPPVARLGLYTGWAGIALATVRAGRLLGDQALVAGGLDLARCCTHRRAAEDYDLIGGRAGAILALLQIASADGALFVGATELGDELIAAATKSAMGWSWAPPTRRGSAGLTGLAHGAAGVGYALLELWRATGEVRFRRAAEAAYAYERHWFDPARGNWADLRERHGRNPRSRAFVTAWCHGAPGIALSRLRAAELLSDGYYLKEAQIALETTCEAIAATLLHPQLDFSLCHGLAGLAEVLLAAAATPSVLPAAAPAAVLDVARTGVARYAGNTQLWPGGLAGETPALLVGLAGIGLFYLRRHDPATPSPLLPLTLAVPTALA